MARSQDPAEQIKFLVSCIHNAASGKPNFQAVADELGIVSKAAAQKRYERLLKAHGVNSVPKSPAKAPEVTAKGEKRKAPARAPSTNKKAKTKAKISASDSSENEVKVFAKAEKAADDDESDISDAPASGDESA